MSVRLDINQRVIGKPLRVYFAIVVFYGLLLSWWVFFFSRLGDQLAQRMESVGVPLSEAQQQALDQTADEAMRMFIFEGGFLGLLVLLSVYLVMRSVQRESTLAMQQRNFVSAVTHELRSPLASARLYIDSILMKRTDESKTERYLRHAREDLDRLGSLIEDILLTRRMSDAGIEVEPDVLDLRACTEAELERLADLHREQGAQLRLLEGAPAFCRVDPTAFPQMLENLVSNALKYGGEDRVVEISIESRTSPVTTGSKSSGIDRLGKARRHSKGGWVVLSVCDHGAGLNGVDPAQLMEPFVRGGDEEVRTRPGAGLGLFIVREFASAHGGVLSMQDGLAAGGTRVSLSFPAASSGEAES